jgi:RsmE family RNA methyltransferase
LHIFTNDSLNEEKIISLSPQTSHHLIQVRRYKIGQSVTLFNGRDGTWSGIVDHVNKINTLILVKDFIKPQDHINEIHLAFSTTKRDCMTLSIEQATQLGVKSFFPLVSDYTNNESRFNHEKLQNHITQSCQQCERNHIPLLHTKKTIQDLIDLKEHQSIHWLIAIEPRVFYKSSSFFPISNDERKNFSYPFHYSWNEDSTINYNCLLKGPVGVIVGPEGGFSPKEYDYFFQCRSRIQFLCLSPFVLRSETAALYSIFYLQQHYQK